MTNYWGLRSEMNPTSPDSGFLSSLLNPSGDIVSDEHARKMSALTFSIHVPSFILIWLDAHTIFLLWCSFTTQKLRRAQDSQECKWIDKSMRSFCTLVRLKRSWIAHVKILIGVRARFLWRKWVLLRILLRGLLYQDLRGATRTRFFAEAHEKKR